MSKKVNGSFSELRRSYQTSGPPGESYTSLLSIALLFSIRGSLRKKRHMKTFTDPPSRQCQNHRLHIYSTYTRHGDTTQCHTWFMIKRSGATRKPVADSGQNRFFFSARLFSQCWCEIRNHSWYISCSPRALLSLIYKLSRAISTLGRRLRALNSTREAQNKREPAALSIATDQNSIPKSSMTGIIDDYDLYDDPLPSETGGSYVWMTFPRRFLRFSHLETKMRKMQKSSRKCHQT